MSHIPRRLPHCPHPASLMIRRNPTLITMTDSDVQDVRDMIALKRAEAATAAAVTNGKGKGKGKDVPQPQTPFVAAEEAKRKREAMSRDERLGI